NLTYRPQSNYSGQDGFTFKVNDGKVDSVIAAISITVTPVNDPPLAQSQSVMTLVNVSARILLSGSDAEGSPLTYVITASPVHGTLSGQMPDLTYTPQRNYMGSDSFRFQVNDGQADSPAATVSITVKKGNLPPNGRGKRLDTVQSTSLAFVLE